MTTLCMSEGVNLTQVTQENYVGALLLGGTDGEGLAELGPIIGIKCSHNIIAQIQTAFDNTLHITPFGDKPGELIITVLSGSTCGKEDESDGEKESQADAAFNYYKDNRYKEGEPLSISLGRIDLQAILYGIQLSADPESLMSTATLTFVAWFEDS